MGQIEKSIIIEVQKAVRKVFPESGEEVLKTLYLEIPKEKRFGDFSTNIAMRLGKELKQPPDKIAEEIVAEIKNSWPYASRGSLIGDIKVERPGFINFYLSNKGTIDALGEIIKRGKKFGHLSFGTGKKVQIEFVSANPTGPLTVAHGRQAAIGDSLARILSSCGYRVTREYYINDEGVQMLLLGKSVKAHFMRMIGMVSEFPENGYKGEYIRDIAEKIKKDTKGKNPAELADSFFSDYAYKDIMRTIKRDLEDFGVKFDGWYSQENLSKSGKIKEALDILQDKGFLYKKDGATWFRSTAFGDDKDRVVIKSDGSFTYLAPDLAYHREKFNSGYDKIINIWGPDHHGYINRIKAAWQAFGFDKEALSVLICQLVTLYRDKKPVRMSTREGEFVTLRQVIDEVGRDAGRFFFMMRKRDSHLDFDLELAKSKSMDNPVYYIQYAHARIASIIKFSGTKKSASSNLELLDKPEELEIIKTLTQYPKIIEAAAKNLEPYILLAYLQDLAGRFHSYYDAYRVVTDDVILTDARIALIRAIKIVFTNGLDLLGVSALDEM